MAMTKKFWEPVDFAAYLRFIRWPVVAVLVVEIGLRVWWGGVSILSAEGELIAWVVRILFFIFLAWRAVDVFGESAPLAAIVGGFGGFFLGAGIAIFRFFDGLRIWKFFNLFTESVLAALVGALVAVLVVYLISLKNHFSNR